MIFTLVIYFQTFVRLRLPEKSEFAYFGWLHFDFCDRKLNSFLWYSYKKFSFPKERKWQWNFLHRCKFFFYFTYFFFHFDIILSTLIFRYIQKNQSLQLQRKVVNLSYFCTHGHNKIFWVFWKMALRISIAAFRSGKPIDFFC